MNDGDRLETPPANHTTEQPGTPVSSSHSPEARPKDVAFELLFTEPSHRARLPMRVAIYPHDATESIITTVKNFYGLYDGIRGISFEDERGNTLIARYENFRNGMTVYVRAIMDPMDPSRTFGPSPEQSGSPIKLNNGPYLPDSYSMLPPQPAQALTYGEPYSPANYSASRQRSASPAARGRSFDLDGQMNGQRRNYRSRSALKSRGSSAHGSRPDLNDDHLNGYDSSDGGQGSVTSSFKTRSEQLASAEISLDNIVEGGRRKRAKFESSELPLFVPPQVPLTGSSSSVSPARNANGQNGLPSYAQPGQRYITYTQPLPSPQSFIQRDNNGVPSINPIGTYATPLPPSHKHHLRARANGTFPTPSTNGTAPGTTTNGVLPTPDPTVASCISDEDVAIQLMRLGDASNISNGTRKSTSTVDDALSGAADVASSESGTSDSEEDSDGTEQPSLPPPTFRETQESSPIPLPGSIKKRYKHLDEILPSFDSTEPSGDETDVGQDHLERKERKDSVLRHEFHTKAEVEVANALRGITKPKASKSKPVTNGINKIRSSTSNPKPSKASKPRPAGVSKTKSKPPVLPTGKAPISPSSLPAHSRKASTTSTINFQHQLGEDEEDLSSKPRCQRCRKSKKGCDRQRPCQRCKDAGIGADGCLSEDEGNGRKGRFGRHMGVPVKKGTGEPVLEQPGMSPPPMGPMPLEVDTGLDKSKKRKRST
ncbi:MAG: hypothetical protein M4579_004500 [Chaenotheca gracillima]|nr:MAG: hypothetical protein M4579_004500 [Chaenotheca gracillima]